ncbi:hypothetical protein BGZ61DRAFT_444804 [Ilyonectria robusta]|uniref:uncharacterized protein n=1 Tax=Ilyonectria robusta TaxID=1079257 RepID=UPI001E8CBC95|nr:uncharacterized protein BGZ61DRAFT_444804 [Ilyonectria robusta]KAH8733536.1 hypothetical protein BGZ61DRAFT_444804 [Ilyonectria robusta]
MGDGLIGIGPPETPKGKPAARDPGLHGPSGPARWEIISLEMDAVALRSPERPISALQPHDILGLFGGQALTRVASTVPSGLEHVPGHGCRPPSGLGDRNRNSAVAAASNSDMDKGMGTAATTARFFRLSPPPPGFYPTHPTIDPSHELTKRGAPSHLPPGPRRSQRCWWVLEERRGGKATRHSWHGLETWLETWLESIHRWHGAHRGG